MKQTTMLLLVCAFVLASCSTTTTGSKTEKSETYNISDRWDNRSPRGM